MSCTTRVGNKKNTVECVQSEEFSLGHTLPMYQHKNVCQKVFPVRPKAATRRRKKTKNVIQAISKFFASHANTKTTIELEIEHEIELHSSVLLCNKYCVP